MAVHGYSVCRLDCDDCRFNEYGRNAAYVVYEPPENLDYVYINMDVRAGDCGDVGGKHYRWLVPWMISAAAYSDACNRLDCERFVPGVTIFARGSADAATMTVAFSETVVHSTVEEDGAVVPASEAAYPVPTRGLVVPVNAMLMYNRMYYRCSFNAALRPLDRPYALYDPYFIVVYGVNEVTVVYGDVVETYTGSGNKVVVYVDGVLYDRSLLIFSGDMAATLPAFSGTREYMFAVPPGMYKRFNLEDSEGITYSCSVPCEPAA